MKKFQGKFRVLFFLPLILIAVSPLFGVPQGAPRITWPGPTDGVAQPILKGTPIELTAHLEAGSWEGQDAGFFLVLTEQSTQTQESRFYADGTWTPFYADSEVRPFAHGALGASGVPALPRLETGELGNRRLEVKLCVVKPGAGGDYAFNHYSGEEIPCGKASWVISEFVERPATASGELASVSLTLPTGAGYAVTRLQAKAAERRSVTFEVAADSMGMAQSLWTLADPATDEFPNHKLRGVSLTATVVAPDGQPFESPLLTMKDGKAEYPGLYTLNPEAVQEPAELKALRADVRARMGLSRIAVDDIEKVFKPENLAAAYAKVDADQWKELARADLEYRQRAGQGLQVPQSFPQYPWFPAGSFLWRPMGERLKVAVTVEPGTEPFTLTTVMDSIGGLSGITLGIQQTWGPLASAYQRGVQQELEARLTAKLGRPGRLKGGTYIPPTPDEPSGPCREYTETFFAKTFSSAMFAAVTGGVMSSTLAAGAGLTGASVATAESMGAASGWMSGAFFDGLEAIDRLKYRTRLYAVNAFLPFIDSVESQIGPTELCVHPVLPEDMGRDKTWFDFRWYNVCHWPIIGTGDTENQVQVKVTNPIGFITYKGLAMTDVTGAFGNGALYDFQAVQEGTTTIELAIPGLNSWHKIEHVIHVVKCACPLRPLRR